MATDDRPFDPRTLVLAGLVLATLAGPVVVGAPGVDTIATFVRSGGRGGVLLYVAAYVLSAVALLPGSALTFAAGLIWGPIGGMAVAVPSSWLASAAAFALARAGGRDWVASRLARYPRLMAVERAFDAQGARLVTLLRLSPVFPYNVLNYALGASRVSWQDYALGSAVGMFPGTLVYVWLGALAAQSGGLVTGSASLVNVSMGAVGLVSAAAVVAIVARHAGRTLDVDLADRQVHHAVEVTPVIVDPTDAANKVLLAHTRPPGWVNPAPRSYDLLVVGGGPAGLVAAVGAAGLGARVALVERHLLGGDCLVSGCVPSKALLRAARAAHDVADARRFGVDAEARVDFGRVMERLRGERAAIAHHDAAERIRGLGIDVHFGEGRFVGRTALEVGGQRLEFSRAVIATGARPAVPSIPGLDPARVLTSDTVWALTELPRRLVVIGGGPIGCELAQSFRRLGAEVELVSASDRLLPRDEPDAAEVLASTLTAEGVRLSLGAKITRVEHGAVHLVHVDVGGGAKVLEADAVLVAAGRVPNVDGLGLEAAAVSYGPRGLEVDDQLRTTNGRIYAAGDVASPWHFTHAADALARMVVQNALFFGRKRASRLVIPWVTFTDPEVAQVGLTVEDAKRAGHDPLVLRESFAEMDRPVVDGSPAGFAQFVLGRGGRILGATIVGRDAGDAVGEVALAMTAGLSASALSSTIHPYPTRSEVLKRLGDRYQRSRLTPAVSALLRAVLALRTAT